MNSSEPNTRWIWAKTSKVEQFFYYMFKRNFQQTQTQFYVENISYDIYVPELNLLIEYNGFFHKIENNHDNTLQKIDIAKKEKYNFLIIEEEKHHNEITTQNNKIIISDSRINEIDYKIKVWNEITIYIKNNFHKEINKTVPLEIMTIITRQYIKELKEKSIVKTNPEILKYWDYEKNEKPPQFLTKGSKYKVWLKCNICNESYLVPLQNATKKNPTRCPVCFGTKCVQGKNDFLSLFPQISNFTINPKENFKLNEVKPTSHKRIEIKCHYCDSIWVEEIRKFTKRNCKCKFCEK
jgi:hypothetical protein